MTRALRAGVALSLTTAVLAGCAQAHGEAGAAGSIKVMNITAFGTELQNFPDVQDGTVAAVKAINAHGGVHGRRLELITCNTNSDPNTALNCARKAVRENVVVVLGYLDNFTTQTLPLLEQAGIPNIGLESLGNPIDYTSKSSFPFDGGTAAASHIAPFGLKSSGATTIVAVSADVPSAIENAKLVKKGAIKSGLKFGGIVKVPTSGVSEYSSYAQQIKEMGGDGVYFNTTVGQLQGVIKAARAMGLQRATWSYQADVFGANEASGCGALCDGLLLVSPTPAYSDDKSDGIKKFNADMDAAGFSKPGQKRPGAINAWMSVYAFKDLLEGQGSNPAITGAITAKSVTEALDAARNVSIQGITEWSPGSSGPAAFPRVRANTIYRFLEVKGGDVAPTKLPDVELVKVLG
ncbi:ABC transporter substrate-binding protein [Streptomyces brasiliensis]|uniref:Leucine-binding protein domain-containing protein n=1 Tax=Streptomyces brasiliensis TaxID=1954 RepID=A0A917KY16_9ACTN|nr:ABC transporter substrate-binding protein [Streptomyces brasiliensis]GGJ35324.1 hypothetical protein GCM10010121_053200 [Streptomyces brasiliensis]